MQRQLEGLSGHALPEPTRQLLEPQFAHDFSHVRIHRDSRAAQLAFAVGARAFNYGPHVVFGQGEYAPGSAAGLRLLAHELAHVAQQDGRPAVLMRWDSPQHIISHFTTNYVLFSNLDERSLGQELAFLAGTPPFETDFVLRVFRALNVGNRAQVAEAMIDALSDDQLRTLAASERECTFLLRVRDWIMARSTRSAQALRILERLEEIGPEDAEPVESLDRLCVDLRIVHYAGFRSDVSAILQATMSILGRCGIDIDAHITYATPEQTTRDLGDDQCIDLTRGGGDREGDNVKRRAGYDDSPNQVPVALVHAIRTPAFSTGIHGYTARGGPSAVSDLASARLETLAHEIGRFYGLTSPRYPSGSFPVDRRRLMYTSASERTGERLLPWECMQIRGRIRGQL